MENSTLIKHSRIRPENIDYHQFTLSLLNEGLNTKLLSTQQLEQIQIQLMGVLGEIILQYTRNDSSSVKTEIAQGLLQSILYCIDLGLAERPSLEESMETLQNSTVVELHVNGLKVAEKYLTESSHLLDKLKTTIVPNPIVAYNETIHGSFEGFFENYDARFDAHNTMAMIDYPLLFDDASWTGIIYIKKYLEHLLLENEFCSFFDINAINALINACGEKFKISPTDLMVNIPDLILKNSICSILMGHTAENLVIEEAECAVLETRLKLFSKEELAELLSGAVKALFLQLNITDNALQNYLQPFAAELAQQMINALKVNALSGLIVFASKAPAIEKDIYISGSKLSDEALRLVISELADCENGERKADLIQSEISNIEDLIEVFNSACIFGNEYNALFERMTEHELKILSTDLVDSSPFSSDTTLSTDRWQNPENNISWQRELKRYLEEKAENTR